MVGDRGPGDNLNNLQGVRGRGTCRDRSDGGGTRSSGDHGVYDARLEVVGG